MKFNVPEMSCGHCRKAVQGAITELDSAAQVDVDLEAKTVQVESSATAEQIIAALDEAGYDAALA